MVALSSPTDVHLTFSGGLGTSGAPRNGWCACKRQKAKSGYSLLGGSKEKCCAAAVSLSSELKLKQSLTLNITPKIDQSKTNAKLLT